MKIDPGLILHLLEVRRDPANHDHVQEAEVGQEKAHDLVRGHPRDPDQGLNLVLGLVPLGPGLVQVPGPVLLARGQDPKARLRGLIEHFFQVRTLQNKDV